MTIEFAFTNTYPLRPQVHPDCVVCSPANTTGMQLRFEECTDGKVHAAFTLDKRFEGYSGCIHGGVVSSILDGAMTNCMFSRGLVLVTAELKVRFLSFIQIGQLATVSAWVRKSSSRLYVLEAEVVQQERLKATAVGKFMHPV